MTPSYSTQHLQSFVWHGLLLEVYVTQHKTTHCSPSSSCHHWHAVVLLLSCVSLLVWFLVRFKSTPTTGEPPVLCRARRLTVIDFFAYTKWEVGDYALLMPPLLSKSSSTSTNWEFVINILPIHWECFHCTSTNKREKRGLENRSHQW